MIKVTFNAELDGMYVIQLFKTRSLPQEVQLGRLLRQLTGLVQDRIYFYVTYFSLYLGSLYFYKRHGLERY